MACFINRSNMSRTCMSTNDIIYTVPSAWTVQFIVVYEPINLACQSRPCAQTPSLFGSNFFFKSWPIVASHPSFADSKGRNLIVGESCSSYIRPCCTSFREAIRESKEPWKRTSPADIVLSAPKSLAITSNAKKQTSRCISVNVQLKEIRHVEHACSSRATSACQDAFRNEVQ